MSGAMSGAFGHRDGHFPSPPPARLRCGTDAITATAAAARAARATAALASGRATTRAVAVRALCIARWPV